MANDAVFCANIEVKPTTSSASSWCLARRRCRKRSIPARFATISRSFASTAGSRCGKWRRR
jgi:hypothetical protein